MVIILTGENSFMLQAELRRIVDSFVHEHTDMALEQFDGEEAEFDRMREALQSLPFLASKKLVVLRAPGANKQFLETAEELLANVSDVVDVLIVEPKLDKRTAYYKFLKKQPGFKEFLELDNNSLAKWLAQSVSQAGGTINSRDASYLVERVGANQLLLSNEITKLLSYNRAVSRASIDLLTERTPQSTIFDLLDAALSGKKEKALSLYKEQRAMKVEPQQVMALLGWQLHVLAVIKTAGDRDPMAIASEAKINPYVVRKSQGLARSMSTAELKSLIHETTTLDGRMKSESIDADEALQNLIISLNSKVY